MIRTKIDESLEAVHTHTHSTFIQMCAILLCNGGICLLDRENLYLICNLFTKPQYSLNNSYLRTVEEKSSKLDLLTIQKN